MGDVTIYEPRNLQELEAFAVRVTRTKMIPPAYQGKPEDALVAMMYGKEIADLGPLASLQSIAVINGKPAFYGDALPGIAFRKGLIVDMVESFEGEPGTDAYAAVCTITRKVGKPVTQRFSVADAKRAGLWGKSGPWSQYPQRMLQWRARSWAIRDAVPQMLFGPTVEEMIGHEEPEHVAAPYGAPIDDPADAAKQQAETLAECLDAHGEAHMMMPAEVAEWAKQQAAGATDEELTELAHLNVDQPAVLDAVMNEQMRRRKPKPAQLDLMGPNGEVLGTYGDAGMWLAGLKMMAAEIPGVVEINRPMLERMLCSPKASDKFKADAQALLAQAG